MPAFAGKIGWKLMTIAVGIPIGIAARKVADRAWEAARPGQPPRKVSDPDVGWGEALGWAAMSGVAAAAAELVTLRSSGSVWRSLTGHEPPAGGSRAAAKRATDLT